MSQRFRIFAAKFKVTSMKYTLKRKGSDDQMIVLSLGIEEGKIMFPIDFNATVFGEAFQASVDQFSDRGKWSGLIDSLHFIDNLHDVADSYMAAPDNGRDIQACFMDFVEDLDKRIRMIGSILDLDLAVDYGCTDDLVRAIFWILLTRVMDDAEHGVSTDASTGEAIEQLLNASVRKEMFRGIVAMNEAVVRDVVENGKTGSEDEKEFFQFVEDTTNQNTAQ